MDPAWPDGGGLSWGVVVMSSAAVWAAGQAWGSHEGCPESLVPLLTKSQMMLENQWPSIGGGGIGVKRGGVGGRGRYQL